MTDDAKEAGVDEVERILADVEARWRKASHEEAMAAEEQVSVLHDLARRVEGGFGADAGMLVRRAADLVAEAADQMRRAQDVGSETRG